MGKAELEALVRVIQEQLDGENLAVGTWSIVFNKERGTFAFDKCEAGGYCEERPAVIALDGTVLDRGGPLLG